MGVSHIQHSSQRASLYRVFGIGGSQTDWPAGKAFPAELLVLP
jgi:hypothetical protein